MSQDSVTLDLQAREVVGKRLRNLRQDGQVPGVIHDHGKDSVVVQGELNAVTKVFNRAGRHHIVELKVASKSYNAMIKDVSRDPRKNYITHIVFNAVEANEKVETDIPVHIRYAEGDDSTPAERAGFIVLRNAETVQVEALPKDLPDELYFAADKLTAVGDQATVADLDVPGSVTVKAEPTTVLATVFEPSALQAANDAAGGDAEAGDEAEVESEQGSEESEAEGEKVSEEAKSE